jgi:uncharacterized protein
VLARGGMWLIATVPGALTALLPILLGWIAARGRLLDEPWRRTRVLTRLAIGGIAFGWLAGLPDALVILGVLPLPDAAAWAFSGLNALGGIACGVGYAAAFGLLAVRLEKRPTIHERGDADASADAQARKALRTERAAAHAALSPRRAGLRGGCGERGARAHGGAVRHRAGLAAVGQRSLTFYLFQSLLMAPLLASWGLGLAPHLSTASAVAIAFGVWLASLPIAAWLDSRGDARPGRAAAAADDLRADRSGGAVSARRGGGRSAGCAGSPAPCVAADAARTDRPTAA